MSGPLTAGPARAAALRGIFWMVMCTACQGMSSGTVRWLAADISVFELAFFQSAVAIVVMGPFVGRLPRGALRAAPRRAWLYFARAAFFYLGALASFYAYSRIGIADAQALMFTTPLFTILLASLLLREAVGGRDWIATAIGLAGALVIVRPGVVPVDAGALAALGAACAFSLANIVIRRLARTEDPVLITLLGNIIVLPLAAVPAALSWTTPEWRHVPWILALGLFFMLAQLFIARSIGAADARIVQPFSFLRLLWAALIGWVLFAEFPDALTWVGAAIIVLGAWDILRREAGRKAA